MSPAKKSVIAGEYILSVLNNGSIEVCRSSDNVKIDNVKEALRQIAKQEGFEYDPNWNTRQFGNKLLNFLNGNGVNATTEETLDVSKGGKYTIELSLWAKGVQLLDVTEEEKDELSEENLNDVFYDWASKYDYDFYYERQFICPDTEYFELIVRTKMIMLFMRLSAFQTYPTRLTRINRESLRGLKMVTISHACSILRECCSVESWS